MVNAQAISVHDSMLLRAIATAVIPWAIGEKINVQTWDTQEQIDACCSCCKADCSDCLSMKKSVGGKGHKRDITQFAALYGKGWSKEQICSTLNITRSTYYRLVKDYKGSVSA